MSIEKQIKLENRCYKIYTEDEATYSAHGFAKIYLYKINSNGEVGCSSSVNLTKSPTGNCQLSSFAYVNSLLAFCCRTSDDPQINSSWRNPEYQPFTPDMVTKFLVLLKGVYTLFKEKSEHPFPPIILFDFKSKFKPSFMSIFRDHVVTGFDYVSTNNSEMEICAVASSFSSRIPRLEIVIPEPAKHVVPMPEL